MEMKQPIIARAMQTPDTNLVIHSGQLMNAAGATDGSNTTFEIYDLSKKYQTVDDSSGLMQQLAGKNFDDIQNYINQNKLMLLTTSKTNGIGQTTGIRLSGNITAVLIVQVGDRYDQAGNQTFAQPTVINLSVKDNLDQQKDTMDIFIKSTMLPTGGTKFPSQPNQSIAQHSSYEEVGENSQDQSHGWLPETGRAKQTAIRLGIILMLLGVLVIVYIRREKKTHEN